jgi:hypothetical protein
VHAAEGRNGEISVEGTNLEGCIMALSVNGCTECDDTRYCDNTICPPEDGHVDVRKMSRIVM